jgi:hypothetical protein
VYADFKQAHVLNRPAILLIEDNIPTFWEHNYHNTIRFNRHNINQSIDEVNQRIRNSQLQAAQKPGRRRLDFSWRRYPGIIVVALF